MNFIVRFSEIIYLRLYNSDFFQSNFFIPTKGIFLSDYHMTKINIPYTDIIDEEWVVNQLHVLLSRDQCIRLF